MGNTILKKCILFFFFALWSIMLQFDFRVKIWINSHFLQNDSLLYTKE